MKAKLWAVGVGIVVVSVGVVGASDEVADVVPAGTEKDADDEPIIKRHNVACSFAADGPLWGDVCHRIDCCAPS